MTLEVIALETPCTLYFSGGPQQGRDQAAHGWGRSQLPAASQCSDPILVGGERGGPVSAHACQHRAVATGRVGVREVWLQARAVNGSEPARGGLSGRRELRRRQSRRERLLRRLGGRVGGKSRATSAAISNSR